MAKLTIEIDMDDPQETWDALYRRIEEFGKEPVDDGAKKSGRKKGPSPVPASGPATYDLLLDPERSFGDMSQFLARFPRYD